MNTLENPLAQLISDCGFCAIFRQMGCIGDSLASGEMESQTNGVVGYHDYYEHAWGQYIARACGSVVHQFSRGGLTAKEFLEKIHENRFNIFDAQRKCQAYIVTLGCNDITAIRQGKLEFGTIADIHPNDPDQNANTFTGYMGRVISCIKSAEEKARIFMLTIPVQPDSEYEVYADQHAELIGRMAQLYPFTYVIDLRKYGPVYDNDFRKNYFLGNHLNVMGYMLTARMLMTYIDCIIREKPEEFSQVGFIGKGDDLHNETALW